MKFGVLIVLAVNFFGINNAIHFRSVGKNYNINYNSNTNTNLDLSRLYETIVGHLDGSEIKAPQDLCSAAAGGQCSQLYEHLSASFSSDHQDEFEEEDDFAYDDDIDNEDTLFPEEASGGIPSTEASEDDRIVKLIIMPISDEKNPLEIGELDAALRLLPFR